MATPRFETLPTEGRAHRLDALVEVAEGLHLLMPEWWVRFGRVATELDSASGLPAYPLLVGSVPRRSAKTTLGWVFLTDRGLNFEDQSLVYTSYSGHEGRSQLMNDYLPLLERSEWYPRVSKIVRSNGFESITFDTGSTVETRSQSQSAGHGHSVDFAVIDEAWVDADNRREAALAPGTMTRPGAQMLILSTAGHAGSVFWNTKLALAEKSVGNPDSTIAAVHYAAARGADPEDETVWPTCMPMLRHPGNPDGTVLPAAVRHNLEIMDRAEWTRANYNIPTATLEDGPILSAAWVACQDEQTLNNPVVAVDSSPSVEQVAVVAADADGSVKVLEIRSGVVGLVGRLVELANELDPDRIRPQVVLDRTGPLAFIAAELERAGVDVPDFGAGEYQSASAAFRTAVADMQLHITPDPSIDAAAAGARQRETTDRWEWERTDESAPLIAASMAYYHARTRPGAPMPFFL